MKIMKAHGSQKISPSLIYDFLIFLIFFLIKKVGENFGWFPPLPTKLLLPNPKQNNKKRLPLFFNHLWKLKLKKSFLVHDVWMLMKGIKKEGKNKGKNRIFKKRKSKRKLKMRDRKWIKKYDTHIFKLFLFKKTWNLFFGSNWVYTMHQGPWAIGHGFSLGLIQKVRYQWGFIDHGQRVFMYTTLKW